MIDLGMHKGERVFYTEGKSLADLIIERKVWAIPAPTGLIFKRTENTTELERMAAYSIDEVRAFAKEHGTT